MNRRPACARRPRFSGRLAAGWVLLATLSAAPLAGTRWPQFRGENASGTTEDNRVPTVFGADTNLAWRVPLGPGRSSPCVWDGAVFLTAFVDPDLRVLCLDAGTGVTRWERPVPAGTSERGSGLGSPAAPTPCTDGTRVVSYFGPFGVLCHDFDGRELWRRELPTPATQHGVGTSPVLAGDRVILLRDADVDSHLLALDKHTGATVWRVDRPEFRRGFCTPLVIGSTAAQVIVAPGTLWAVAYAADTGRELWRVAGLPNEVCASPVAAGGLVFATGWTPGSGVPRMPEFETLRQAGDRDGDGRLSRDEAPAGPAQQHFHYMDADRDGLLTREEYTFIAGVFGRSRNALLAVRPPPAGEPSPVSAEVVWSHARGLPYVPTPLVHRGRLYLLKNGGLLTCLNAADGAVLFQEERLGIMGDNYASPVAAGDQVVVVSQTGAVAVVLAADTLEVRARNALGERVLATPAIAGNTLFIRSESHLWAFRETP